MNVSRRTILQGAMLGGMAATPAFRAAHAATPVTFLFPAIGTLLAALPFQLAQARGYYADNGLAVTFQVAPGGANVAKQVGAGNGDLGLATADLPIIVRANGVPVRGVALLGGHPVFQLAMRKSAGVTSLKDLKGRKIGVANYQDASFYSLLGVMAAEGITRTDVQVPAVEAAGISQLTIAGSIDGAMALPEQIDAIETAGTPVDVFPIGDVFPALAQGILASDATIRKNPDMVRAFVHATLRSIASCIADPAAATRDYCAFMPAWTGKDGQVERIERRYATQIYPATPASSLGRFDPVRLGQIAKFYYDNKIVQTAVPVEELYTNDFIG
jgi:NitT/TauT family transport system substrate-binding protein